MKLEIAHAVSEDASGLSRLAALAFPLACPPTTSPADIEVHLANKLGTTQFENFIADDNNVLLVARYESMIIGFALLVFQQTKRGEISVNLSVQSNTAELSKFYVHPDHHGTGSAQTLMSECLQLCQERGWGGFWLNVNQLNERANRFYAKFGFAVVGECEFSLGQNVEQDYIRQLVFDRQ